MKQLIMNVINKENQNLPSFFTYITFESKSVACIDNYQNIDNYFGIKMDITSKIIPSIINFANIIIGNSFKNIGFKEIVIIIKIKYL